MTTEVITPATPANGTGAPANGAPPATPANGGGTSKTEQPNAGAVETISMPKDAFEERISKAGASATRKLLQQFGFEKPEDLGTALGALKKLQDEQLSELDRHKKRVKELEPVEAEAKEYRGIVEQMVEEQFKALPEAVQSAIDEVAQGKPRERMRLMKVMKAAGVVPGASTGTPPAKPPAAPANVTPAGGPAPPPNGGTKSKYDEWKELQGKSAVHASTFYQLHRVAIEESWPAEQR